MSENTTRLELFNVKHLGSEIADHQRGIRELRWRRRASKRPRHHPRVEALRPYVENAWRYILGDAGFSAQNWLLDIERALVRVWEESKGRGEDLFGIGYIPFDQLDALMVAIIEAGIPAPLYDPDWFWNPALAAPMLPDNEEREALFHEYPELQAYFFCWLRTYEKRADNVLVWPPHLEPRFPRYDTRTFFSRFHRGYRRVGRK